MARLLMAFCVLVALALPRFIYGRPAIDDKGSTLSMSIARGSESGNLSNYEQKGILSLVQGSVPAKSRQRRLSDQRRAELETLMTLSRVSRVTAAARRALSRKLDLAAIGRRRRSTTSLISPEKLVPIPTHRHIAVPKHGGDPAYPLIS